MLTLFIGISGTLFLVSSTLYLIGIKLKKQAIINVTRTMPFFFLLATAILTLIIFLPDSRNILKFTIVSIFFAELSVLFLYWRKNRIFIYLSEVSFILSTINWFILYAPSFPLYPEGHWFLILYFAIFLGISYLLFKRFLKPLDKANLVFRILELVSIILLQTALVVTLYGEFKIHSFVLLVASIGLMISHLIKEKQFPAILLYITSELLLISGTILIQINY